MIIILFVKTAGKATFVKILCHIGILSLPFIIYNVKQMNNWSGEIYRELNSKNGSSCTFYTTLVLWNRTCSTQPNGGQFTDDISYAFYWMCFTIIWLKFHCTSFLGLESTARQNYVKYCLGVEHTKMNASFCGCSACVCVHTCHNTISYFGL